MCVWSHTSWNLGLCGLFTFICPGVPGPLPSTPEATLEALLCGGREPTQPGLVCRVGLTAFPGPMSRNERLEGPELGPVGTFVAQESWPPTPEEALT